MNKSKHNNYKTLPNYLRPNNDFEGYLKPGMFVYNKFKQEINDYIDSKLAIYDKTKEPLVKELIIGAYKSLQDLEQLKNDSYFVPDHLCNDEHFYVDYPAYYRALAGSVVFEIEEIIKLLKLAKSTEEINLINKELKERERYLNNIVNKIAKEEHIVKLKKELGEMNND